MYPALAGRPPRGGGPPPAAVLRFVIVRILVAALLAIAAACAHSDRPAAEGRRLQLLFTGDGYGEVGPCG